MRQSQAAAPKCPQCGRAAETPVREEPKPAGPGCIDEMGKVQASVAKGGSGRPQINTEQTPID